MSYYDIDAILTDAQKLPCTFTRDLPGLGYISGNAGGDIKASQTLSLPIWLGSPLAVQSIGGAPSATIDMPPFLAPRVLHALKAGAVTVDLRALAPYFYGGASRVLELFEEDEIAEVVETTFKLRAESIADHAHNATGMVGEGVHFLRGLEEMERQLFRAAHDGSKAVRMWMGEAKKKT